MADCLDASFVLRLVAPDEKAAEVLRRYAELRAQQVALVAPALLAFEVAAVLRKKQARGVLDGREVTAAWAAFRELGVAVVATDGVVERALALSQAFGRGLTVHDAAYVAVAESRGGKLWTCDEALWRTVAPALPWVEYVPPDAEAVGG